MAKDYRIYCCRKGCLKPHGQGIGRHLCPDCQAWKDGPKCSQCGKPMGNDLYHLTCKRCRLKKAEQQRSRRERQVQSLTRFCWGCQTDLPRACFHKNELSRTRPRCIYCVERNAAVAIIDPGDGTVAQPLGLPVNQRGVVWEWTNRGTHKWHISSARQE